MYWLVEKTLGINFIICSTVLTTQLNKEYYQSLSRDNVRVHTHIYIFTLLNIDIFYDYKKKVIGVIK